MRLGKALATGIAEEQSIEEPTEERVEERGEERIEDAVLDPERVEEIQAAVEVPATR
ncbi:hypothetical protein ACFWY6_40100 [Streptomyces sp. NPDC059037]|uniref:hypothetical protein n=1 Tax=Streptomyces sp. NPDC059037 TaxID=3346710 RepID=UPI0036AD21DA